jgi:hypothetical protein
LGQSDDAGASRSQIARRSRGRSESTLLALHIHSAARSDFGEPRIVDIVEPQLEPGYTQFGDEIETADPRSDDRYRFRRISVCHGLLLALSLIPDIT